MAAASASVNSAAVAVFSQISRALSAVLAAEVTAAAAAAVTSSGSFHVSVRSFVARARAKA